MWFLLLWALGIITSIVYFFIYGFPSSFSEISRILLLHQFVVTFGLVGLIGFVENIILGDKAAKAVGWPGGPYQKKYGFSQIGLGLMGVMAIWFQGNFWVGVLVNMYIYGLSGFWTHIAEMVKFKKLDSTHMMNLVMNICYQTFITVLSIWAGTVWHFNRLLT
jgi:hypothetical protein